MYRERGSAAAPGSLVWTSRTRGGHRVLPDGCTDIMWLGDRLVVAGPDTTAYVSDLAVGRRIVGIRFAPGVGPAVLGTPADALRDQRVDLAELWTASDVERLTEALADASPHRAAELLESAADGAYRAAARETKPDRMLPAVVAALAEGQPVGEVGDAVGLSERQLHRRSLAAFGYGPKTLARILRSRRALDLARAGTPLAETAAVAGYADQAHFARDVRALTGTTITDLLAA